jgi:GGDEF domain-containing protein
MGPLDEEGRVRAVGGPTRTEREEQARALGARLLGYARALESARETAGPEIQGLPDLEQVLQAVRDFARADLRLAEEEEKSIEQQLDRKLDSLRQRRRALSVIESSLEALLGSRPVLLPDGSELAPDPSATGPDWAFLAGASPGSEAEVERLRYRMAWLEARSEELETQCRSVLEQSGLDPRTGLLSEQSFWARVEAEARRAYRSGHPVSAAAFACEQWTRYAERSEVDLLARTLSRAGRLVRRELHRPGDVVGRSGAGLLLLLPSTAREGARQVAGRVQRALENHGGGSGGKTAFACRGGTIWPRKGGSTAQLKALVLQGRIEVPAAVPKPA